MGPTCPTASGAAPPWPRRGRCSPLPALPDCHVVLQARLLGAHAGALRQAGRLPHPPPPGHRRSAGRPGGGDLAEWPGACITCLRMCSPSGGARRCSASRTPSRAGGPGGLYERHRPTVFGLFDQEEAARRAYELLQESYRDTFLARSLEKWYRNRHHRPQCRHYTGGRSRFMKQSKTLRRWAGAAAGACAALLGWLDGAQAALSDR